MTYSINKYNYISRDVNETKVLFASRARNMQSGQ
jgi:hypothetical protein